MALFNEELQERLSSLREQGRKSLDTYKEEFEEHHSWLESVLEGLRKGTINVKSVLVPKTPGKQRQAPLSAIKESLESSVEIDDVKSARISPPKKRVSRKAQTKKATAKSQSTLSEVSEDVEIIAPTETRKRLSEETLDITSKRLCGNRSSDTTSRDSGLSSVGSCNTNGRSLTGLVVKLEVLTPKNTSLESSTSADRAQSSSIGSHNQVENISAEDSTQNGSATLTEISSKKRSRSTGRSTFIVKEEPRRSSRCQSEPRTPNAKRPSRDKTLTGQEDVNISTPHEVTPLKSSKLPNRDVFKSPLLKQCSVHLLKGETVKKAVQAFEALNEDHESGSPVSLMPKPTMLPPKTNGAPKTVQPSSSISALDEALTAPTRVTRTKTRAMAKAAAAEEGKKTANETQSTNAVSKILKSPTPTQSKLVSSSKPADKKTGDVLERENSFLSSSKIVMKPFGSASKQPPSFLKHMTPLNRGTPLTPNHSASSSFSVQVPRLNNLITSVESFILKPVVQEVKPSREENLQKLAAKAEVASKKKEEMMKAQLEEKIKKRQEKRLKVCAAREAMEKEKLEMLQKLEREREEKQKQLLAEREEKLRQEYLKKKRLAQQKAAETEERRRQEEAARLAKLKQQEEEQKRLAALRKKEQEEAERKQMERQQQEREAAAFRAKEAERMAKEAERLAKQAALKAKAASKAQLDVTYDMASGDAQSYGITPGPEERKPLPNSNPDNYGIDDAGTDDSSEDEAKPKKAVPLWAQAKQRMPKLKDDYEITHQQMFIFFESRKSTPDLSKIFTAIDRRQLIRKSSAVWRTPPGKY